MTSDPTEPDRPADAPPGTINLPLPSVTVGASNHASPLLSSSSSSVFSPGPTDPPIGAGAPMSTEPVEEESSPHRLIGHRRRRVVVVGIALTTAISLLAITLLYYRWATKAEPTASIVVWGGTDQAWDGASVIVRGGGLRAPLRAVVRAEDNLIVRFHVPPGDYIVRVESPTGKVLGQRQNAMQQPLRVGTIWWPFRAPPAATQASAP